MSSSWRAFLARKPHAKCSHHPHASYIHHSRTLHAHQGQLAPYVLHTCCASGALKGVADKLTTAALVLMLFELQKPCCKTLWKKQPWEMGTVSRL